MIRIDKILTPTPTAPPTATPTPHPHDRSTEPRDREASRTNRVKLPKLTIRPFNGDLTSWTTFWDSFEAAIHKNDDLSDIDKFNYLRSLLEHTAREAISGLSLTSTNYGEAISILKKRFGSKQQIVNKHMDVLLNVEPVTSPQNVRGLRHLYDLVESHVRSLKSLGVTTDSYGSLLSPVLLNKLPPELRLIVSREVSETDWSLDSLMKVTAREVEARERAAAHSGQAQQRRGSDRTPATATALVSGTVLTAPSCCYCQQAHPSTKCSAVTSVEARKEILKKNGRCFSCLRRGHMSRDCRSSSKCHKCNGRHHVSICTRAAQDSAHRPSTNLTGSATPSQPHKDTVTTQQTPSGLNPNATAFTTPSTTTLCLDTNKAVLLQTALADIYDPTNPQSTVQVRMFLDSGSQRSYITRRAKDALALVPESKQHLSIAAFGSEIGIPKLHEVVRVGVRMKHSPNTELMLFTVPHICDPLTAQPVSLCAEMYDHLSSLDLADSSSDETQLEVDVLVGCDYYWELATGKTLRGKGGPIAIHTKLGWVLSGPAHLPPAMMPLQSSTNLIVTHILKIDANPRSTDELNSTLRSFWDLESLGICHPDKSVYDEFESSIQFKEGRYEVSLPWKKFHDPLPDNYELTLKWLHGLLRRLRQDPTILREYDLIIRDQINKGIVQIVADKEDVCSGRVHYLPHHAVIRYDKETTKIRVVYDASAKSNGPSLNDCLYAGPKFDQKILDILLRFRSRKVALTADIEKAFLMISVAEPDRDVLRFLWVSDIHQEEPEVIVLRFAGVMFGVSSSPFLLNATIKHHVEKYASQYPELVRDLLRSIYVDDIVFGADNDESAFDLYSKSKDLLKSGSFNLRKFITNSPALQDRINKAEGIAVPEPTHGHLEETYAKSVLGATQQVRLGEQKILGICWNVTSDRFIFNFDDIAKQANEMEPTKRNVVSLVGRFYDPLGFLAPVTIRLKVLFQQLCESKIEWDEPLVGDLLDRWQSLMNDLQAAQPLSIPRSYFNGVQGKVKSYSLYGFCDASVSAYAAVVYLMVQTDVGRFVRFIVSKTRVAPIQSQTIPRLELLSALLLARLISSVSNCLAQLLPLASMKLFTDSKVALFWIQGDKEWKQFVQNRVNEIRKLTPAKHWSHCPGKDNPADVPSRGLTPLELSVNMLWRNGPDWLSNGEEDCRQDSLEMPEECTTKMRTADRRLVHSLLNTDSRTGLKQIMRCEDYSSLSRLFHVTAYVLKFVRLLKEKNPATKTGRVQPPQPSDIAEAERLWIVESQLVLMQERCFDSWKKQFGLFLDKANVWRCGGRLINADIPYSAKHPVLLTRKHPLTLLIVKNAHERVQHNGVKETLTEIRAKYWIVKGRSLVKSVIHQCVPCRRFEGRPFHPPPPPPLPIYRVKEEPPFSCTAVDFAGPLYVKTFGMTESKKTWICLYTCCVTCAVHLDVVPNMSAATFIRSLKRFCARRGLPHKFLSDNGKTFKAAAKTIEAIVTHQDVKRYLSKVSVEWCFNLEKAPWWGGVFERLIKSTKRCLRKMVGQAKFSYDELLTAVIEVEAILNSRPLSYVSADDLEEPLTPSHLLVGRRLLNLPDGLCYQEDIDDDDFEVDPANLTKRARHLNNVINHFWKRWRREYLLELREAHRCNQGSSIITPISVGDIVLLYDDGPRGFWKLARIEKLITGKDEQIRGAVIRVPAKDGQTTLLQRPLQLLYPLEITRQTTSTSTESDSGAVLGDIDPPDESTPADKPAIRRSRRSAATQASNRIKACILELESS